MSVRSPKGERIPMAATTAARMTGYSNQVKGKRSALLLAARTSARIRPTLSSAFVRSRRFLTKWGTKPGVSRLPGRGLAAVACLIGLRTLGAQGSGSPEQSLLPAKPRGEIPPGFWEQNGYWVLLIGALLLAVVCIAAWYLTQPKSLVAVPPEVETRRRLERLRQRPEDGSVLSMVSQILRHYLADAFGLPRDEMTTAEFCRAMETREQIGPELSTAVARLLRQCDRQKFAPPPTGPPLSAADQALALVDVAQARLASLREAARKQAAAGEGPSARQPLAKEAR
jgi:Domain of unknown function (DUF4381)